VYQEVVVPALERGVMVIMDRSIDSGVVYQGMARGLGREIVEKLNEIATRGRKPDVTFLLDIPLTVSQKRKEADELDRLELEAEKFHHQVRRGYLQLWEEDGGARIKKINATRPVTEVFDQVVQILEAMET
ncbi:dTMP kinase, partial [bacterium]|nr:dTMP kinase [bacterium]